MEIFVGGEWSVPQLCWKGGIPKGKRARLSSRTVNMSEGEWPVCVCISWHLTAQREVLKTLQILMTVSHVNILDNCQVNKPKQQINDYFPTAPKTKWKWKHVCGLEKES